MRCPQCTGALLEPHAIKKYETELDCCPQCGGVWFDKKELEALLRVAAKAMGVPSDAAIETLRS